MLHPPLPSFGVSIGMKRGVPQNDSRSPTAKPARMVSSRWGLSTSFTSTAHWQARAEQVSLRAPISKPCTRVDIDAATAIPPAPLCSDALRRMQRTVSVPVKDGRRPLGEAIDRRVHNLDAGDPGLLGQLRPQRNHLRRVVLVLALPAELRERLGAVRGHRQLNHVHQREDVGFPGLPASMAELL